MYAKQNTARTFIVGPVLDADGVADVGVLVAAIKVTKNGTVGAPDGDSTLTHDHTGHYKYYSDGDDFDTLGEVTFSINDGTSAMTPVSFQVLSAGAYDALITSYSATRGLAGTALPAAAADAAGGLPVSDAGGLDMDALDTYAVSAAAWRSINSGIIYYLKVSGRIDIAVNYCAMSNGY